MQKSDFEGYNFYPTPDEIDAWAEKVYKDGMEMNCRAEFVRDTLTPPQCGQRHNKACSYVKFTTDDGEFYGIWQQTLSNPAPLLVHVPGYGAEMSIHPQLVSEGYNILHISPMGYVTPNGNDESKKDPVLKRWPVFMDSIETDAKKGYAVWLAQCVAAIKWANSLDCVITDRISFMGTSQGGGGALLLASVYKDHGVKCVSADVPFLTNYPLSHSITQIGAYDMVCTSLERYDAQKAWHAMGYIDTYAHAHRLTCPTMLVAGGKDTTCPHESIQSLYDVLPKIKSINYFDEQPHGYTMYFPYLVAGWMRMFG